MADQTMRVVQVGTGGIAQSWVGAMRKVEGVELVGLVDLSRDAAVAFAKREGLSEALIYGSLSEAVKATGAEVVFDTTVPGAHASVTTEAFALGCHVLGEKPMSDTLADAQRMVEAARKTGKMYGVTQTRRPLPQMVSVADFLGSEGIGALEEVHCDFYMGVHFGGFRDEMDYPLILDMAIHTFDNARQISGADPVSVYCHCWNPPHSWSKGDMSACVIFEMVGADGQPIVFTYRGSWVAEGNETGWEAHWRCVGARGSLVWDGGEGMKAEVIMSPEVVGMKREMEEVVVPMQEMDRTGHEYLIHDFYEAYCSGGARLPMCHYEDNIKSLAMVDAAVQSAKTGQKVAVVW